VDSLRVIRVTPKRLPRLDNPGHAYSAWELLFTHFIDKWSRRLSEHILLCRPVGFIFREVILAILSLASGEYKIWADQSPLSDRSNQDKGHFGSPCAASVLPYFGSGFHFSNVAPGSAPDKSIYRFKGFLIVLADGLFDEVGFKGEIATVPEMGRDSGHKTFDEPIKNLRSFILVRVVETAVQHTDSIKFNYTTLSRTTTSTTGWLA
jgi:hypothetical protein